MSLISAGSISLDSTFKRQATRHDCLPSLLGDGDKLSEKLFGEENFLVQGQLEPLRQNKNLLYRYDEPNELTQEGHLQYECTP